jgi:ArsR family transcriptional regulator
LLSERVVDRAASLFRAIGEPGRLRLLHRLCGGELCVGELADEPGGDMSLTSQRLKTLRAEGLVTRRREGKHVYYALSDQHVATLVETTLLHAAEPAQVDVLHPSLAAVNPSRKGKKK